jgi:hypothetical protein
MALLGALAMKVGVLDPQVQQNAALESSTNRIVGVDEENIQNAKGEKVEVSSH